MTRFHWQMSNPCFQAARLRVERTKISHPAVVLVVAVAVAIADIAPRIPETNPN